MTEAQALQIAAKTLMVLNVVALIGVTFHHFFF
jgi:hypothetical protein